MPISIVYFEYNQGRNAMTDERLTMIEDDQRGEVSQNEIDAWLDKVIDRTNKECEEQCEFFENVSDEEFFW